MSLPGVQRVQVCPSTGSTGSGFQVKDGNASATPVSCHEIEDGEEPGMSDVIFRCCSESHYGTECYF